MSVKSISTKYQSPTDEEVRFFWDHGYLHIPGVFTPSEIDELSVEMDRLMGEWARDTPGWSGAWRRAYMDEATERKSRLIAMHDLQYYSAAWMRAVTHSNIVSSMTALLGPNVELHHTTMHVKPPQTGHPFPMHQDHPFYKHTDNRYVDTLVHLDETNSRNGEIRFLDGSIGLGPLEHITQDNDGSPCSPHLPTNEYRLEDTVAVPARPGDIVVFNIHTIHGSYMNTTNRHRRLVRVGYRDPENLQLEGQSAGRPGWMIAGGRTRGEGDELITQT